MDTSTTSKIKLKVAFFDFACCEGCQVELTNYGDDAFLELLKHIEVVEFREIMSETTDQKIDIACIEGSFTRNEDISRLQAIRARSDIIIAYGQCAVSGGINALKNHQQDYLACVYAKDAQMPHLQSGLAKPISEVIKVDYKIFGCPINKNEFLDILTHLLHAKEPIIANYPVCIECKRNETICRYSNAEHCLGMVARAGCGAPCPSDGIACDACRGFVDKPNQPALTKVLIQKANFTPQRASDCSQLFNANERDDLNGNLND